MATHCSILAWRIPWTEQPGGLPGGKLRPWGLSKESDTTEQLNTSTFSNDLLPIFLNRNDLRSQGLSLSQGNLQKN